MAAFAVSSIPITLLSKVAAPIIHFIIDGRRSNPMSSFGDGDDGSRQAVGSSKGVQPRPLLFDFTSEYLPGQNSFRLASDARQKGGFGLRHDGN